MYICTHIYIYTSTSTYIDIYICLYMYMYISKGKMDSDNLVVNGAEPVPGAMCATRRSRISDQQRAPPTAPQRSWIPK